MTQLDWLSPAPARPRREGSTGTIRHGHPFPAPSHTPAANKGSDKERAQVKTSLTPFQAQMSGFSADFTPHPSCLPPRGGGWDTEWHVRHVRLAGWTQKTPGPRQGHRRQSHTLAGARKRQCFLLSRCHTSGRTGIMDFGFRFLLLTYGHGESKASHSLIE